MNVTLKVSTFQASTPTRHVAELLAMNIISKGRKPDAFVLAFTDGGPDHNISFLNVMISWLGYFILGKCDFRVVARTAPTQSWTYPAVRLMSVLNLALSNCALSRQLMSDEFENTLKKCSNMKSVRKLADEDAKASRIPTQDVVVVEALNLIAPLSSVDANEDIGSIVDVYSTDDDYDDVQGDADNDKNAELCGGEASHAVVSPALVDPLASISANDATPSIDVVSPGAHDDIATVNDDEAAIDVALGDSIDSNNDHVAVSRALVDPLASISAFCK